MNPEQLQAPLIGSKVVCTYNHGSQAFVSGPLPYIFAGVRQGEVDDKVGLQRCLVGDSKDLEFPVDGYGWMTVRPEELDGERSQAADANNSDCCSRTQSRCFDVAPHSRLQ